MIAKNKIARILLCLLALSPFAMFQNCGGGGGGGGGGDAAASCDTVCGITNGADAASATTYWRIPQISCGQLGCYTKIAFFADGTGRMTAGTNNCAIGSTRDIITFSWLKTGSNTMLFANTTFTCSPNPATTAGVPLSSFTSITGSMTAGMFAADFNALASTTAALQLGTFW